jgi:hypothetical protein
MLAGDLWVTGQHLGGIVLLRRVWYHRDETRSIEQH